MTDRPRNQWWRIDLITGRHSPPQMWRRSENGADVPVLSGDFHADVAAELRRLRKIEAAAKVIADRGDDRFHLYVMPDLRNLRDALGKEPTNA